MPDVTLNVPLLEDSVGNNMLHQSHGHHAISTTAELHAVSTGDLTDGHKHAHKKRNRTYSESSSRVANCDGDVVSKEQHWSNTEESAATCNADHVTQGQTDHRLEPSSGIKDRTEHIVKVCILSFWLKMKSECFIYIVCLFSCTDGSHDEKKKSKKKRSRNKDDLPDVASSEQLREDSVGNDMLHQSDGRHAISTTDELHAVSTVDLTAGHKHTHKKRNRTYSESSSHAANCDGDVLSKEQHWCNADENTATCDADHLTQGQTDGRLEPLSGIKYRTEHIVKVYRYVSG